MVVQDRAASAGRCCIARVPLSLPTGSGQHPAHINQQHLAVQTRHPNASGIAAPRLLLSPACSHTSCPTLRRWPARPRHTVETTATTTAGYLLHCWCCCCAADTHNTPRPQLPLHTCTHLLRCCQLKSHTGVTWTLQQQPPACHPLKACMQAAACTLHGTQAAALPCNRDIHTHTEREREQTHRFFVVHTYTLP